MRITFEPTNLKAAVALAGGGLMEKFAPHQSVWWIGVALCFVVAPLMLCLKFEKRGKRK